MNIDEQAAVLEESVVTERVRRGNCISILEYSAIRAESALDHCSYRMGGDEVQTTIEAVSGLEMVRESY